IVGGLVITVSIIAMAEVARPLRFVNVPFGLWLMIAPWLLTGAGSSVAVLNGVLAGLALVALSLPRGRRSGEHYGGWDRFVV
ncbi:MAG: SPW repeat domain-containing protein, partial [Hyphomicrobiales bacterium]